jgi:hypothetical protein
MRLLKTKDFAVWYPPICESWVKQYSRDLSLTPQLSVTPKVQFLRQPQVFSPLHQRRSLAGDERSGVVPGHRARFGRSEASEDF